MISDAGDGECRLGKKIMQSILDRPKENMKRNRKRGRRKSRRKRRWRSYDVICIMGKCNNVYYLL